MVLRRQRHHATGCTGAASGFVREGTPAHSRRGARGATAARVSILAKVAWRKPAKWPLAGSHRACIVRPMSYRGLLRDWVVAGALALGQAAGAASAPTGSQPAGGEHDFDFEFGSWKTHISRLVHPLSGSTTWVEYEGTSVVRKVWDGRANLLELEVSGPAGHIEALSLRLYNPESRQWSLNFSNRNVGALGQPTIGEFKNGRGEFYDQESLDGRAILVRFVISEIKPDSCHFEQAFSMDGGRTWEVNWIATDTRVNTDAAAP